MKTLVVVPHCDDESISCGGLIQKRITAGGHVCVLPIYGRVYNYGRDHGVAEHQDFLKAKYFLGYQTAYEICFSGIEGEPHKHGYYLVLEQIEKTLKSEVWDEVVGPAHDDLNQDHRFVAHALEIALRPINLQKVSRVLEFFALDGQLRQPSWYEVLTEPQLEIKIMAVNCYQREVRRSGPRSSQAMRAQAIVWGENCGKDYAEAYRLKFTRH